MIINSGETLASTLNLLYELGRLPPPPRPATAQVAAAGSSGRRTSPLRTPSPSSYVPPHSFPHPHLLPSVRHKLCLEYGWVHARDGLIRALLARSSRTRWGSTGAPAGFLAAVLHGPGRPRRPTAAARLLTTVYGPATAVDEHGRQSYGGSSSAGELPTPTSSSFPSTTADPPSHLGTVTGTRPTAQPEPVWADPPAIRPDLPSPSSVDTDTEV